jgi:tRNA pseudouridine55 synthase
LELESRKMVVDECTLLEWYAGGQHDFAASIDTALAQAPAARIRLTVCSGFYVRSFAHDLGIACGSRSHMATLLRTRQGAYAVDEDAAELPGIFTAITYADLDGGEHVWGAKLRPQLEAWVAENPAATGHVNGRDGHTRRRIVSEKEERPKQRFRGGWIADTKQDRIKQQGGKYKGKWGPKVKLGVTVLEDNGSDAVG